ncbi:class I adenylate-forming enzyme family protein [Kitasatospora sp. NPDC004745]|uniref:class I adenylate-forming enzyme family protein n=1 Tax=unclassified Kitasatospora TaxID=2633591 RepID=UPI0033D5442A
MPANDTYVGRILRVLAADPDRTVLTWQDGALTAGAFTTAVRTAAQTLLRHGGEAADGGTGAVVAILTTTNSPATLILRYAANLIGATAVHLHTTNAVDPGDRLTRDAELAILTETGATVLAVDAEHLPLARDLAARLPKAPALAALADLGPDVLDLSTGADTDPPETPIPLDRAAVITYTSGTTGRPKGIAVDFRTRNGFITAGLQMAWRAVYLATLPMSHSSGATADDSLASGGSVILHQGFDAGRVLRTVAEHRVTRLLITPPQLYRLMDHPESAATDLSSLVMLCYTGSPASPARLAEAVERFGDVLIQIYGTSEAGAIGMLTPAEHREPDLRGTVGRVLAGEVRVRDPHDHRDLPTGELGEICVRSPFAMREYLGDPELTARTVRDGWVHTGDLGRLDERGYIHLSGRLADVVKTNGIKIHPTTVENALTAHPGVLQAAAFGVPDGDLVEHLHAAVVLRDGAATTEADLREHLATALSPQHVPAVLAVRPDLPLTPTGKPDRARLVADTRR